MRKLKAAIAYECLTSFKHIWIFYGITFSIVGIILIIIGISTGDSEVRGTISLEVNSMVYVGILGVLGFKEDFKMLMQNGFTRKYIFIATLSLFAFISSILSLIDTIVSRVLHEAMLYDSVFGGLYGFDQPFIMNWLILYVFGGADGKQIGKTKEPRYRVGTFADIGVAASGDFQICIG